MPTALLQTTGISAHEYAAFLRRMFEAVTVQVPVMGLDGRLVMLAYVWKDEQDVQYDETYEMPEEEEEAAAEEEEKAAGGPHSSSGESASGGGVTSTARSAAAGQTGRARLGAREGKEGREVASVAYREKAKSAAKKGGEKNRAATVIQACTYICTCTCTCTCA